MILVALSFLLSLAFPENELATSQATAESDDSELNVAHRIESPFQIELKDGEFPKWIRICVTPGPLIKQFVRETASGISPRKDVEQVYRKLQSNWKYKYDPKDEEWLQSAEYSVAKLEGDCEDYASCMASCLTCVGATVRLVTVRMEQFCHCYCELLVGSATDRLTFHVMDQLVSSLGLKTFAYRRDGEKIWLALDFQPPTKSIYAGEFLQSISLGMETKAASN